MLVNTAVIKKTHVFLTVTKSMCDKTTAVLAVAERADFNNSDNGCICLTTTDVTKTRFTGTHLLNCFVQRPTTSFWKFNFVDILSCILS